MVVRLETSYFSKSGESNTWRRMVGTAANEVTCSRWMSPRACSRSHLYCSTSFTPVPVAMYTIVRPPMWKNG